MVQVRNNMSSGIIFKNPEKPTNHKPMIAAGIVVGYNFLKDRNKPAEVDISNTSSGTSSSGAGIALCSIFAAIFSPLIALLVGVLTNNDTVTLVTIPIVLVLSLIGFIYALNVKD